MTYLFTETYEASALILVRPRQEISISNQKDRELLHYPVVGSGFQVETPSKTSIELIKSRTIAEQVIRHLNLDEKPEDESDDSNDIQSVLKKKLKIALQFLKYGRFIGELSPLEKAIKDFQENISLSATKETYVFEIKYEAEDPKTPVDVANATAEIFIKYMIERNKDTAKSDIVLLQGRMQESESELKYTQDILKRFKEDHEISSFEEELSEKVKILASLENLLEKESVELSGRLKRYTRNDTNVKEIISKIGYLRSAIQKRKKQLTNSPDLENRLKELELNVNLKRASYELITREYEEARIHAANNTGEFLVASEASAPLYPSGPKRLKYTLAIFCLACMVGVGLILFLEYINTTIRTVEQAERQIQLRVLSTIPDLR